MHHLDDKPVLWCPTQAPRGFTASFRRYNVVIATILAFIVIACAIAALTPGISTQASAAKAPTSSQSHANAASHQL
jgi:hypothetical protein